MRDLDKNNKETSGGKTNNRTKVEHPECNRTVWDGKVLPAKKTEKVYKVTITYIKTTDEEAKIKLAIIESLIKKSFKK